MKCKNYLLSLLENIPLWYEDVQASNIRNVILTYLRGLEIAELKEEDMPMV